MKGAAHFTVAAVLISICSSVSADLVFNSPPELTKYSSVRCVEGAGSLPKNFNFTEVEYHVKVDKDFCNEEQTSTRYNGTIVDYWSVKETCGCESGTLTFRTQCVYDHLIRNKVLAFIEITDRPMTRKLEPFNAFRMIATAFPSDGQIPFIVCQYVEPLSPGYVKDEFLPHNGNVTITVFNDVNRFETVFDNMLYKFYFHGFGVVCLVTSFLCGKWYKERTKNGFSGAGIPELMLIMEGISMALLGLFLLISGMADTVYWPYELSGFVSLFTGTSLATSSLAGIFFLDLNESMVNLRQNQAQNFWKSKKKVVVVGACICFMMDFVNLAIVAFEIPYFVNILASICLLGQIILGTQFIRSTSKFLNTGIAKFSEFKGTSKKKKKGPDVEDPQVAKLKLMAKYLRLSAVCMLIICCLYTVPIFSGTVIYGVYAPEGWVIFWVIGVPTRYLVSWTQIMLAKPREQKKGKKTKVAPRSTVNSVASDIESDVSSSSAGSSVGSSGSSASSSPPSSSSRNTTATSNYSASSSAVSSSAGSR